jgi:hypothetical protein
MRRLLAACAAALGVLALAGPAGAGVIVGVNDDAGKYAEGAPQFWTTMQANGLKVNAVTVLWDETQPTAILDEGFITKSLPAAEAAGIKVVLDVYPMHSKAFTDNPANVQAFGAFLTKLAQTFPSVTEYVVMNECNQTRFVNPQFNASGVNQSAALCGRALAAGYDALKAVNPSIFVWGIGLSPRGNDNAQATSNVSTSPVKFLAALGLWYRSSGRTTPIMDGFDFHPYPIPQSLPFATGYADKDNAAVSNLDRIYQAFYDAFKGTGQPTIGQHAGGGLPVSLNEVGIQTDNSGKAGYVGSENAATPDGGVRGETSTESFQAKWYVDMLNLVACDPNVKLVNLFHLVDESDLGGWQSGLFYVGYTAKSSASAVNGWINQTGGNCTGAPKRWKPGTAISTGGTATPTTPGASAVGISSTGLLSVLFKTRLTAASAFNGVTLPSLLASLNRQFGTALQDTRVTVSLSYVGAIRATASASARPAASATVLVKQGKKLAVVLKVKKLKAGNYRLRYDLKAVKGAARATVTTKPFALAANGKLVK